MLSIKYVWLFCFLLFGIIVTKTTQAQFVRGADASWLPMMEATGYSFYDSAGVKTDCLLILKDKGINTIRLRVWVNPSTHHINGHCSKNETVAMALRAQAMGMRVMIDFHYSDTWADPAHQTKPLAWTNHTFTQLLDDVYNHTYEVLDTLKKSGITPAWAQIGNEIAGGMLWPDGSSGNFPQLAQLLNKGYDAAKAVDSSIKVIVHLESGNDNSKFRWFFDKATTQGVRYDIIGLSYYPYWIGTDYTASINNLAANMNDMVARYNKEVMVVEVGGDYTKVQNTYDMLVAVIEKTSAVPGGKGSGVIYWEPQGAKSWSGYQLCCWGQDGKPTAALNAFLTSATGIDEMNYEAGFNIYPNPCYDGIIHFEFKNPAIHYNVKIFDSSNRLVKEQKLYGSEHNTINLDTVPGVYIISVDDGNNTGMRKLVLH